MAEKVLIVDDATFMRTILTDVLKKNGYEIAGEAKDGEECIDKYMELKPDLVIMDIVMPKKDGLEATKEILAKDPSARILMCSQMGQESMVMASLQAGARGFVVKPFKPGRLLELVENALK